MSSHQATGSTVAFIILSACSWSISGFDSRIAFNLAEAPSGSFLAIPEHSDLKRLIVLLYLPDLATNATVMYISSAIVLIFSCRVFDT